MFIFYCDNCKKTVTKNEVDIQEMYYEEDFQEVHEVCGNILKPIMHMDPITGRKQSVRLATPKQLAFIESIEMMLGVKFLGSTIQEASAFISEHIESYRDAQEFAFNMIYNPKNY